MPWKWSGRRGEPTAAFRSGHYSLSDPSATKVFRSGRYVIEIREDLRHALAALLVSKFVKRRGILPGGR